ncbi:hypothetical protein STEG23_018053 [Scotinomys teguina]
MRALELTVTSNNGQKGNENLTTKISLIWFYRRFLAYLVSGSWTSKQCQSVTTVTAAVNKYYVYNLMMIPFLDSFASLLRFELSIFLESILLLSIYQEMSSLVFYAPIIMICRVHRTSYLFSELHHNQKSQHHWVVVTPNFNSGTREAEPGQSLTSIEVNGSVDAP